MAKSIKFRASFTQPDTYGLAKVKEVVFSLGLGPCGRVVTKLDYEILGDLMVIRQTSFPVDTSKLHQAYGVNSEIKQFTYKMSDVHGRIEATL